MCTGQRPRRASFPGIAPTQLKTRLKFSDTPSVGEYAGIVFGFNSLIDYRMLILKVVDGQNNDKLELYHVTESSKTLEGSKDLGFDLASATYYQVYGHAMRGCLQRFSTDCFSDGYPSGKVGLVSNSADVDFDYIGMPDDALHADTLGRWWNNTVNSKI